MEEVSQVGWAVRAKSWGRNTAAMSVAAPKAGTLRADEEPGAAEHDVRAVKGAGKWGSF